MEEEIEEYFRNETLLEEFEENPYLDGITFAIGFLVGITANILIILSVAKHKTMRTRTNLLIMNYSINNIINLLLKPALITEMFGISELQCIAFQDDEIFQFMETVFIFLLVIDTIVETKRISNILIFAKAYFLLTILIINSVILCVIKHKVPLIFILMGIILIALLITVVSKDIYRCCVVLSEERRLRLNVARIYIYVLYICILIDLRPIYSSFFNVFLFSISSMKSAYILIYLVWADYKFKICFLSLFKKNGYAVDATIGFNEGSKNAEDDKVNINIISGPQNN